MTFWSKTSSYVPFWARCNSTLAVDDSSSSSSGANNDGSSESRVSSALMRKVSTVPEIGAHEGVGAANATGSTNDSHDLGSIRREPVLAGSPSVTVSIVGVLGRGICTT